VMRHLHALVTAKQVLYLGVSDTPAWVVVKANECEFQQDFLRYSSDTSLMQCSRSEKWLDSILALPRSLECRIS
jgi:aryl-alcohol dehydrogenase-like predicted oxidoreductase